MSRNPAALVRSLPLGEGLAPDEKESYLRLLELFATLPPAPDPDGRFPEQERLRVRFLESLAGGIEGGRAEGMAGGRAGGRLQGSSEEGIYAADRVEEAFLELYCHLHMHEAPYTPDERRRMDATGGYWCHAGGLSPLLKAGPWIEPQTVLADFGAGNGLQGLLFQKLYPHARTVQIEISSRMLAIGRRLQEWLGIGKERVEWIADDVCNRTPEGMDFIYIYRPVRPEGEGRAFYERFASALAGTDRPVVIFSIADCLREFLPGDFVMFYGDGHLTCYRRGR